MVDPIHMVDLLRIKHPIPMVDPIQMYRLTIKEYANGK